MSKIDDDLLVIDYLTNLAVNYDLAPDVVYDLADNYEPWDYDKLALKLDEVAVNQNFGL